MNRNLVLALVASAALLCSCDFFRGIAGRPKSADIEAKRAALQLKAGELKAGESKTDAQMSDAPAADAAGLKDGDPLRAAAIAERAEKDSLAALERLSALSVKMLTRSSLGGTADAPAARYCFVVGSFKSKTNAERMAAKVRDSGYAPGILSFRNGMYAVFVEPCDRLCDAVAACEKVRAEKFCPADAWILHND